MKIFIIAGKVFTSLTWLVLIVNLLMPFEGNVSIALNFFLAFTVMMHGFQVLIFHTMFSQTHQLKAKDYIKPFAFGVFTLLEYRQQLLSQNSEPKA
ncbi:DUF1145 domain-containing protein [Shewanella maritima]|uniref:DUF1145 domain-containing protein n=1 Tax=Shewanella maritima TaxID=2520507 RepID=UPI0037360732